MGGSTITLRARVICAGGNALPRAHTDDASEGAGMTSALKSQIFAVSELPYLDEGIVQT